MIVELVTKIGSMKESVSTFQKLHAYARTHTLRRLFLYIWLGMLSLGLLLGLLSSTMPDNVFAEFFATFVGCSIYFYATAFHSIADSKKALQVAKLHMYGIIGILLASIIVSNDDSIYSSIVNYEGEYGYSESVLLYGLWSILADTKGKLVLYASLCLLLYTCYKLYVEGKERYRYIPVSMSISYVAFFLLCLLSTTYEFITSNWPYALLGAFALIPGIMFLVVIIREGNSSIERLTEYKPEQMTESHNTDTSQQVNLAPQSSSMAQKLFQLKELLDAGLLTQEEFDSEKKKILENQR